MLRSGVKTLAAAALRRPLQHRSAVTTTLQRRFLSTARDEQRARSRAAIGVFNWKAAALFLGTGAGLLLYFRSEKERVEKLRDEKARETVKAYGKPKIGGPFELINAENGEKFNSVKELAGRFYMVYFGFTHCPDICPEELDKMAEVVDMAKEKKLDLVPVFITCDPRRDTAEIVKEYVKDFHPDMIGLTGDQTEIRKVAKSFRVYVSSPPNVAEGEDYLVDHSIFFYLMDPEGKFVDCYAKDTTAQEVASSFEKYVQEYKDEQTK
ncbi:SCO1/SenC-domain-containing protein [Zychaea mexicana]|uniref:SCO1/SenC-domain-containing protein n=1 Tax=Zychaea mexicana TaxID=64656 RepID=UPI0022FE73BC|nr:SCO1/SenC-domain-containing protein [Zychaea mexicana]KAI9484669.1 SCO1/SenC-domain-containing protein [Zychaea mexicana]